MAATPEKSRHPCQLGRLGRRAHGHYSRHCRRVFISRSGNGLICKKEYFMLPDLKKLEVWFVTGSQHLYGPETLRKVAEHSKEIAVFSISPPKFP